MVWVFSSSAENSWRVTDRIDKPASIEANPATAKLVVVRGRLRNGVVNGPFEARFMKNGRTMSTARAIGNITAASNDTAKPARIACLYLGAD